GNSARSPNWMRTLEFAIWERAQTSTLRRHSSENTSQVVENAHLLLKFSSPGMSTAAHTVSSENTLQVAENTKMPGRRIFISGNERKHSSCFCSHLLTRSLWPDASIQLRAAARAGADIESLLLENVQIALWVPSKNSVATIHATAAAGRNSRS